jgi:hypothetical protein
MAGNPGTPFVLIGTGVVFAWAGLINRSVVGTLQDLVAGKQPTGGPGFQASNTIAGTGSMAGDAGSVSGNLQNTAKRLLAIMGWSDQWPAFNELENGEGGWNTTAENPTSNAFGLAQALGHGGSDTASPTQKYKKGLRRGQAVNMYGGYGLSGTEAQQANTGSGEPQLKWMMNYIKQVYGDPNHALAAWKSRKPHWY